MIDLRINSLAFFLIFFLEINAQTFQLYDISINYNYTTTSKLFLHPRSSDLIVRTTYQELDDILSYSGEVRFQILESLLGGLWIESIEKTFTDNNFNLAGTSAKIKDGYKIFPLEVSFYYLLPFSTEAFKFFMGGGGGLYFGKHVRQIGDVSVTDDGSKIGYGIQVSVEIDYKIFELITTRLQMRFRDPEIEMKSKYTSSIVNYEGKKIQIYPTTFTSKVNMDGITFSIGIVFHF